MVGMFGMEKMLMYEVWPMREMMASVAVVLENQESSLAGLVELLWLLFRYPRSRLLVHPPTSRLALTSSNLAHLLCLEIFAVCLEMIVAL